MTKICAKERVSTKYAMALKDKDVNDISTKDSNVECGKELWAIIEKVDGVQDVDYDGHFGNYIYVEVDIEHDTKDTWKLIYKLINQYITTIRKDK